MKQKPFNPFSKKVFQYRRVCNLAQFKVIWRRVVQKANKKRNWSNLDHWATTIFNFRYLTKVIIIFVIYRTILSMFNRWKKQHSFAALSHILSLYQKSIFWKVGISTYLN